LELRVVGRKWRLTKPPQGRLGNPRSPPKQESIFILRAHGIHPLAIRSEHLETLEAVIATALNIVKTRPLADLYVRRDYTGDFRIRVQLESGQRYVITIKEE
jgi:hypothetical protein